MKLQVTPCTLREANAVVRAWHRHHRPVRGHVFSLSVADSSGEVHGVVIAGRPVARALQDGFTLEVTRCCTNGTQNCCSLLYAAAWRAAKALGYRKLITYTLPEEGGASLRGAGWTCIGAAGGGSWSCPSRPRIDLHPTQTKLRWEQAA